MPSFGENWLITLAYMTKFISIGWGLHFLAKRRLLQWLEDKLLTFYLKKYRKYTHIRHKYLKQL